MSALLTLAAEAGRVVVRAGELALKVLEGVVEFFIPQGKPDVARIIVWPGVVLVYVFFRGYWA